MKLQDRLIKLGAANPELRKDLIPILAHLESKCNRKKEARFADLIHGTSLLSVNKTVSREVEYICNKVGLVPFSGSVVIRNNKPVINISAESASHQKGHMTSEIVDYAATELVRYLKVFGYKVSCTGAYNYELDTAWITITQI